MSIPLIGNERISATVDSFISAGRFPHALLIEGEDGLGKKALARYLAKAAVCTGNIPPCGVCRDCHLTEVGSHPDISILAPEDKKKSVSVAQVRRLRQDAFVKPQQSARRIIIIEQAHTLNEQSQNALLKILEEPPGDTIFILTAISKSALLPTVLSRCVILPLTAPDIAAATEFLIKDTGADNTAVKEALASARGNIGRALSLLKKRKSAVGGNAAQEYLRLCLNGGTAIDLLRLTIPLEKDRPLADEWVRELRYLIAGALRECYDNRAAAQRLVRLEQLISNNAPLLATNINLSLFFSAIVSETCHIFNL